MFERFTDRARRVLVLAQEEARLLGDSFIGTEHLLLGLMQERDGVAAAVLEALGISYDAVRESVRDAAEAPGIPQGGSSPFTPRAKKVLELSLREALQLGHPYIGTEHLLLGLLGEGQGVAIYALTGLGADLGAVRRETIRRMEGVRDGPADTVSQFHAGRQVARSREWAPPKWDRPSEGTVPIVLAIDAPVIQSDVVGVTLEHLEVYSNGFSINVLMRVNPHKVRDMLEMLGPIGPDRWPNVGVRFGDGRTAIPGFGMDFGPTLPKDEHGVPSSPIVSLSGLSGPGGWRASAWVFPLPPEGPVEVSFGFAAAGLEETSVTIDGGTVRAAAARARVIWS